MVGPMARPGARGLGPGLGLKYEGQVCTTAAGPGRAWASNHVCGPGLGLDFRPVQGPTTYIPVSQSYQEPPGVSWNYCACPITRLICPGLPKVKLIGSTMINALCIC